MLPGPSGASPVGNSQNPYSGQQLYRGSQPGPAYPASQPDARTVNQDEATQYLPDAAYAVNAPDPWAVQQAVPYESEAQTRRSRVPIFIALASFLVLVLLVGFWLLITSGNQTQATPVAPSKAVASAATTSSTATATPSKAADSGSASSSATAFSREISPSPSPSPVTASPSPSQEPIDQQSAQAAVENYFSVVAGNPAQGWALLSRERQAVEDMSGYVEFWTSISQAAVSNCIYAEATQSIACTLNLTTTKGVASSTTVTLYLVREDGIVKIDKKRG